MSRATASAPTSAELVDAFANAVRTSMAAHYLDDLTNDEQEIARQAREDARATLMERFSALESLIAPAPPAPKSYVATDGLGQKVLVPGNVTFEPWTAPPAPTVHPIVSGSSSTFPVDANLVRLTAPPAPEAVTVTLSRASAQSWLGDLRDTIERLEMMHDKNANYPTISGYFEEFPHVKEVIDVLNAALAPDAAADAGAGISE